MWAQVRVIFTVAVVLEYLLVQISSPSCNVVGSILALHAWKTLPQQL